MASEDQPLLPAQRPSAGGGGGGGDRHQTPRRGYFAWFGDSDDDDVDNSSDGGDDSLVRTSRRKVQRVLTSRFGHYSVLFLVTVDVASIFADFLISLYLCEHECCHEKSEYQGFRDAQDALGIVSLIFSSLFMVELIASIWAFGFSYFKSAFRCLDAAVIVGAFVVDVVLKGVLEEVGSTIVVLRLFRVFKIIDEFSAGAEEQLEGLRGRIEHLEAENGELRKRLGRS